MTRPTTVDTTTDVSSTTDRPADTTGVNASNGRAVLELEAVTKEYPGEPPVRVLHGIDLTIREGELVAIVGPSGSGKSTLLHIVGTLERPTSGRLGVAGRDTSKLNDRQLSALRARELGFVFQQFFLLDSVSALENVADGLLYTGLPVKERRQRATEALEAVGLGHRLGHEPNHLSGGEQQRVAIARALVGRPALLLADEPTGNLDSRSSEGIVELLHELHAQGATIVIITHDQELAAELPRRISLRDGRVEHDSHALSAEDDHIPVTRDGHDAAEGAPSGEPAGPGSDVLAESDGHDGQDGQDGDNAVIRL